MFIRIFHLFTEFKVLGESSQSGRRLNVGEAGGLFFILCWVLGVGLNSLNAHAQQLTTPQASAQPAVLTLDEVSAGQLLFKTGRPGQYVQSLLQDSSVDFRVSGMLARVYVSQLFHNDSDQWVEGVYVFPLPEDAAVDRLRVRIGERLIEGEIRERREAKKIYQQAKASGRKASLVEQERPNLFTNSIANIGPGETIEVMIEYVHTVKYDAGRFELRFPMTLTPRFTPGHPLSQADDLSLNIDDGFGWGVGTGRVPDASRVTPYMDPRSSDEFTLINPITIRGELDMGLPLSRVESPYHDVLLNRDQNRYEFSLVAGQVSMDRDFVLEWQPVVGREPRAAFFSEAVSGEDYGLLMILPPRHMAAGSALPKEMIFIIDTSGSMGGVSIKQARFSLLYALEQLKPRDRFNIIEFNNHFNQLFTATVPADSAHIQSARGFVENLEASGGTNMQPALAAALSQPGAETHLRQVIFITDGAVSNESELFQMIHQDLGASRLFTVGIGSAPNSFFMRKAADFGRGSFTYIANVAETQQRMSELFTKLESPMSSDIEIQWPAAAVVESYPQRVPDLYAGEPVLVAVRSDMLAGTVTVTGKSAAQTWRRELALGQIGDHAGVAQLWGRRKIAHLLDERNSGRAEDDVRAAVLTVALQHQLMSPYTSFIAVEEKISRSTGEALKTKAAPNARPKGQSPQSYAYPQTATRATQSLLFGLLLLVLSQLRWFAARRGLVGYG